MALYLENQFFSTLDELRYQPTPKRIRALIGDEVVADSGRALLVWEPRRVVPVYALPEADLRGELVASEHMPDGRPSDGGLLDGRPVLAVGEFHRHTTPGEPLELRTAARGIAAFRPADPALAGYLIIDFAGPDMWLEEDEEIFSHPRDPFHRVDVRRSSRDVRIERDGLLLAESTAPRLVFETHLPTRYYLPREDVRVDLLTASDTTSHCPFKGDATYFSAPGAPDAFWVYEAPSEEDAKPIAGLLAPWPGRVDVIVDGGRL
jgi:uncharacterized protein (DUF427 family)